MILRGIGGTVARTRLLVISPAKVDSYQLQLNLGNLGLPKAGSYIRVYKDEMLLDKYVESEDIVWVKVDLEKGTNVLEFEYCAPPQRGDPELVFEYYEPFQSLSNWYDAPIHIADRDVHEKYTPGIDAIPGNGLLLDHEFSSDHAEATLRFSRELQYGEIVEALIEPISGRDWVITLALGDVDNVFYIFYSFYNSSINIEYESNAPKVHLTGNIFSPQKYIFGITQTSNKVLGYALTESYNPVLNAFVDKTFPPYINISQSSYLTSRETARIIWLRIRKYVKGVEIKRI